MQYNMHICNIKSEISTCTMSDCGCIIISASYINYKPIVIYLQHCSNHHCKWCLLARDVHTSAAKVEKNMLLPSRADFHINAWECDITPACMQGRSTRSVRHTLCRQAASIHCSVIHVLSLSSNLFCISCKGLYWPCVSANHNQREHTI